MFSCVQPTNRDWSQTVLGCAGRQYVGIMCPHRTDETNELKHRCGRLQHVASICNYLFWRVPGRRRGDRGGGDLVQRSRRQFCGRGQDGQPRARRVLVSTGPRSARGGRRYSTRLGTDLVGQDSPCAPMAASNSPTCGHSNSPRQDGRIMGFLTLSELIARVRCWGLPERASVAC